MYMCIDRSPYYSRCRFCLLKKVMSIIGGTMYYSEIVYSRNDVCLLLQSMQILI